MTIWTEVQDPLHRYVWKPFNAVEDFFKGYDLAEEVPCPHTRECLSSNPSWRMPRTVPPHLELRRRSRVSRGDSRSNITTDHALTQVGAQALDTEIVVTNEDLPPENTAPPPASLDGAGTGSLPLTDMDVPGTGGSEESQDGKGGARKKLLGQKSGSLQQLGKTRSHSASRGGKSKS